MTETSSEIDRLKREFASLLLEKNTEIERLREMMTGWYTVAVTAERDRLRAALEKYQKAMDALYNHNEAVRSAVIQHFGIHHEALRVEKP
jgi:hypothetical protein